MGEKIINRCILVLKGFYLIIGLWLCEGRERMREGGRRIAKPWPSLTSSHTHTHTTHAYVPHTKSFLPTADLGGFNVNINI